MTIYAPPRHRRLTIGLLTLCLASLTSCDKPPTAPRTETPPPAPATQQPETNLPPTSPASPSETAAPSSTDTEPAAQPQAPRFTLKKEGSLPLVSDGQPLCAILIDATADPSIRDAAEYFASIVHKATGAQLPIHSLEEEANLAPAITRLYIGPSPQALSLGLDAYNLPPETYRILTCDNALFIVGDLSPPTDNRANQQVLSKPTLWALTELLGNELGVRWLWPGDLGTYVPRQPDFSIPACDITYQPTLEERTLRLLISKKRKFASREAGTDAKLRSEAVRWAEVHQNGKRGTVTFGHNFGHWWERYSAQHPDYFAELPKGFTQPFPKPGSVKLRLANPKVIDQIVEEYKDAGCPDYWNLCPNDGSGFDVSKETRAWDIPLNQNPSDILSSRGNLTARYVKFWNLIYERLQALNPNVTIVTYAYSSYRFPPPAERPLKAKAIIQFVEGVEAYKGWKAWADQGVEIYLRPNWWHQGADAPYLTLNQTSKYIKFAFENSMRGIDMDSVLGYWGTQGPNYYLVARLMTKPSLTKEEIVDEYTSAFGAGAPKIKEYIAYWERLTERYFYPINAGDIARPQSEFQKLVAANKIPASILNGSKYALPFLYGESILRPAERLLDDAERLIGTNDDEATQRVAFLRKGLESLRLTREQIALGQQVKKAPTRKNIERLSKGDEALNNRREELSHQHVMWSEATRTYEDRYKVLMRETSLEHHNINLDGM